VSISIITTGGTITQVLGGPELRHLGGAELLAGLPEHAGAMPAVEVEDLMDLPSTHIGPDEMLRIAGSVQRHIARDEVDGVVVTHGTATIEETIYFVDLIVNSTKPIVFTGAQRFPGSAGYDGHRNLLDAIVVASSPAAVGLGTVLVFDGEIHAAREVAEIHPSSTAGFQSLDFGSLGRVDLDQVVVRRTPHRDAAAYPVREPLARVDLLTCYAGMSDDVVRAVADLGGSGLIVQGMTSGGVPPALVPALQDVIQEGTVVALTTRCPSGRVMRRSGDLYDRVPGYGTDLERLGIALTDLAGLKARCRLIVLLSSGLDRETVHRLMDTAA
jgi:L-asparaginase